MRRNKRRHIAPQYEFGFTPKAFNLLQESTLDGERIAREQAEAARARRAGESAQPTLFGSTPSRKA